MKSSKKIVSIVLVAILLVSTIATVFCGKVYADESEDPYRFIHVRSRNIFEFNASELLTLYAQLSTGDSDAVWTHRLQLPATEYEIVPTIGKWGDKEITSEDASNFLKISRSYGDDRDQIGTRPEANETWIATANGLVQSLEQGLNVDSSKIHLSVAVTMPKLEDYGVEEEQLMIINTDEPITQEIYNKLVSFEAKNIEISRRDTGSILKAATQELITISARIDDGREYQLVLGTDNSFYFVRKMEKNTKAEFDTILSYESDPQGNMDGSTYLPPYYANEDKDAKKDVDATAIIKSKTTEGIKSTNGVDLIEESNKANSEGWYYPDVNDKTVIAKVYKFDDYDNTKFNGAVSEKVDLVGTEGGTSSETPSIRWTLRRINYQETENKDGSVTVIITYNLPIDGDRIPEGWEPIYDEDGKTIHKITKTIKKGEDYDKDVIVYRNGDIDEKVTTHVKKVWEKLPAVIPQTGAFSIVLAIVAGGIVLFGINRFRKFNK